RRGAPPSGHATRPPPPRAPLPARARVARSPTPLESRAPQKGGEDRRSARCGRAVRAAPRAPYRRRSYGTRSSRRITYRVVAGGVGLVRDARCGMRDAFGHHASRIPPRYVLFLNLMEPFTVES